MTIFSHENRHLVWRRGNICTRQRRAPAGDAGQTLSGVYGGNTGVIKTSEVGTPTPSHELNHGYGGINKDREDNTILPENDIAVQGNNSAAPANRKVTQGNIDAIFKNVDFKGGNKANLGNARPQLFDKEKGYRQVPQK